jgi:hypothetical protein
MNVMEKHAKEANKTAKVSMSGVAHHCQRVRRNSFSAFLLFFTNDDSWRSTQRKSWPRFAEK